LENFIGKNFIKGSSYTLARINSLAKYIEIIYFINNFFSDIPIAVEMAIETAY